MKKNLAHLTGIVLLFTILFAGGCNTTTVQQDPGQPKVYSGSVTIFLKYEKIGEKMQLVLYTEDNPIGVVAAEHNVYIEPGTRIVWRRAADSGILKLGRIGPKNEEHIIFSKDASTILHKRKRVKARKDIVVPKDADEIGEPYNINYRLKETGEDKKADPYLRIKGTDGT